MHAVGPDDAHRFREPIEDRPRGGILRQVRGRPHGQAIDRSRPHLEALGGNRRGRRTVVKSWNEPILRKEF
jgi:hypothetical protein